MARPIQLWRDAEGRHWVKEMIQAPRFIDHQTIEGDPGAPWTVFAGYEEQERTREIPIWEFEALRKEYFWL